MSDFNPKDYDAFMKDWENQRPEYKTFCYDGILNDDLWEKSSKIMFLLKETYDDFWEIRGKNGEHKEYRLSGTSKTFWRRMRMWTYIIDETLQGKEPSFEEAYKVRNEANNSIAYVNLKKYAEKSKSKNMAYSKDNDIFDYVKRDKEYLLKQIDFIKPRIILCAGTFRFCSELFQNTTQIIPGKLYTKNGTHIIDFSHLSQRGSYKKNYDALMEIMKKVKI
jgi:hypothetical protein